METILEEVDNRFVLFPIKYNSIWNMYKKAQSVFWVAEEIDLSKDLNDWEKLNDNEQHFIKYILAFFAGSDGIVNENLGVRFMNEIKPMEAKAFYGFQIAMENIHCVAGSTEILTKDGYEIIENMENKHVEVWNGTEFSNVLIQETSKSSPIYQVDLSNGMFLQCTSQHKWLIEGYDEMVHTIDLVADMRLKDYSFPNADLSRHMRDPQLFNNVYMHGFISTQDSKDYNPTMFNCRAQEYVPVNYSSQTKVQWLSGLFKNSALNIDDPDGCFLKVFSKNDMFLTCVQRLLTTLDVFSSVQINDNCIYLDARNTCKMIKLNVQIDKANIIMNKYGLIYRCNDVETIKVIRVTDLETSMPTYCFNEPLNHTGIFNGILTGQSETYSLLIDTYIKDTKEKDTLFRAINTIPCITKKANWALKWMDNKDAPFAMRVVAFACVEGIFFSGAFCAIFWLKERGVMPGLCLSNDFISRDEALHTEFAVLLYSMLKNKLNQEIIHDIIKEAVAIENEFITDSIPCNMLGMNSELMTQYIMFVADRLVVQLGYDKIYHAHNPFSFMERICLEDKVNFFEHRNPAYSKANVGVNQTDTHVFTIDEEF